MPLCTHTVLAHSAGQHKNKTTERKRGHIVLRRTVYGWKWS